MMSMTQTIFLPDGSDIKVPNKEVAKKIVEVCYAYGNFDVYLLGNKKFLGRLSEDIYANEMTTYGSNANKINTIIGVK